MSVDLLKYQDIVGTLQEWGAVYQKDLFEIVNDGKSLLNFERRIGRLIKGKALKVVKGGYNSREKILYVDQDFINKYEDGASYSGSEYTAPHDALCSRIVKTLMSERLISDYCFEHNFKDLEGFYFNDDLFIPDAIVNTVNPTATFFLEVELSLKSRFRIRKKLRLMSESDEVQNVVYVTTTRLVFNSLKAELLKISKENSAKIEKFYILFLPKWANRNHLLNDAKCFNLGGRDVFGISGEVM